MPGLIVLAAGFSTCAKLSFSASNCTKNESGGSSHVSSGSCRLPFF